MGQLDQGSEIGAGAAEGNTLHVRAPRGANLSCQGWPQEAALRMLMNTLDPDVAEQPGELIACGTTGKVLHDWESFRGTVEALSALRNDETLLLEHGKPAGVVRTCSEVPRVLIKSGGTAASWTYVGTQKTLPTSFLVFDAIGRQHFGGDLSGKLIVSGGMGAAGGALPLAAGMLGAAFLGIEVDGERIRRRIRAGYCDYCVNTLDEALRILKNAVRQKHGVSVGLVGNCAEVVPELADRGVLPDILTDQTSAHDLLNGYIPAGLNEAEAGALRNENPEEYLSRSRESLARHFEGMLALKKLGSVVFEFGNNIRTAAQEWGVAETASAIPGFADTYLQPLLPTNAALVRWVALSGEQGDIRRLEDLALELFPNDPLLARWIPPARKYVRFQGLPARVCWMGQEARIALARRVNQLVAEGIFKAPLLVALDHSASELTPSRDTPSAKEKQEIKNRGNSPALSALLNAASGASWLSVDTGAGCNSVTAALALDGTPRTANHLQRVLSKAYADKVLSLAARAVN